MTVKAVPSGASLVATIGERCRRRASSAVIGAHTMPQQWRMMKAIFSGVQSRCCANEIALVLAVVVIGDDDDIAFGDGLDGVGDGLRAGRHMNLVAGPVRLAGSLTDGGRRRAPHRVLARGPRKAPNAGKTAVKQAARLGKGGGMARDTTITAGRMKTSLPTLLCAMLACLLGAATARAQICQDLEYEGAAYAVCTVEGGTDSLGLYWRDGTGRPYATFGQLAAALAQTKATLVFAMNAGMFQEDLSPVGLFIEGGEVRRAANTRDGPGNFHMKPNGVFYFGPHGAGIMETEKFLAARLHPAFATQSGPMLVIDGAIHPRIQPDGTSLKIRNGVGVRDGRAIVFAISRDPVSFYRFATLFRDRLGCANALFLDGSVSSLYAPEIGSTTQLLPVGPMVGLTAPSH